jgi:hypothetical protein
MTAEKATLGKLLANWRSVVQNAVVSKSERQGTIDGQKPFFEQTPGAKAFGA